MNRIVAIVALAVLGGFIAILAVNVPAPDLIVVSLLVFALAAYDLLTSSGRKD